MGLVYLSKLENIVARDVLLTWEGRSFYFLTRYSMDKNNEQEDDNGRFFYYQRCGANVIAFRWT